MTSVELHFEKIADDKATHAIELAYEPNTGDRCVYSVRFRCWQAAGYQNGTPEYIDCGKWDSWTSDPTKTTPMYTGFVKWDGCHEFHYDDTHGCHGLEDLADRHESERRCLRLSHAVMVASGGAPEWSATP